MGTLVFVFLSCCLFLLLKPLNVLVIFYPRLYTGMELVVNNICLVMMALNALCLCPQTNCFADKLKKK